MRQYPRRSSSVARQNQGTKQSWMNEGARNLKTVGNFNLRDGFLDAGGMKLYFFLIKH